MDPIPWTARYQLTTAPDWTTTRVEVEAEGLGWLRRVKLERAADRWRVTTAEQGDLDAALVAAGHRRAGLPGTDDPDRLADALDVDLSGSPLFNTLPVHRLGLAAEPADVAHRITVAWVLLPGLEVVAAEQIYSGLGPGRVRFASGTFTRRHRSGRQRLRGALPRACRADRPALTARPGGRSRAGARSR